MSASEGKATRSSAATYLVSAASLVVIVAGLKIARPLLLPLVASAFLAALTTPAVFLLRARKIPPPLSVPLILLLVLLVTAGIGAFLGTSVNQFVAAAPTYQERLNGMVRAFSNWLGEYGVSLSSQELLDMIQPGSAIQIAGSTLSEVAGLLSNTLLVTLTTVFILFEVTELPQKFRLALGRPDADLREHARIVLQIKDYVVLKTYVSLGTGALVAGALWLLGVDFPLLWGFLAFLLNYIPNIGSIIAAIPAVLLALVQFGPGRALVVAGAFVGVNMVIGNLVEPRVMGRQFGLSALVVFLSLIFWGWLWGPLGMLLSVPLTMIVRIVLANGEQTRPFAILMGNLSKAESSDNGASPDEPAQNDATGN